MAAASRTAALAIRAALATQLGSTLDIDTNANTGIYVVDPATGPAAGDNVIFLNGTWIGGSGSGAACFELADAVNWVVTFTGGTVRRCSNNGINIGAGGANTNVNIVGTQIVYNGGAGIRNQSGVNTVTKCGVQFIGNSSNTSGAVGSSC